MAKFDEKVDKALTVISTMPTIGKIEDDDPRVRSYLITKHTKLFYRVEQSQVVLVKFFGTSQDPSKALE